MKRDVIGIGACPHCGTAEELRVDRGRQVYMKCFGIVTGKRCGFQCTWPTAESTVALAEAARIGWLGPIPYGYFPPGEHEKNSYAHNLKGKDHEKFRDAAPYEFDVIEPGKRPQPKSEPVKQPEPAPRPEPVKQPEPAKQPEPVRTDPGTQPRRFRLGGGR